MTSPVHQGVFGPHLVANTLSRDPDKSALHFNGEWITRGQVAARTSQFMAALGASGLGPGVRIAILSRNRPEVIYSVFAAMFLGAVHAALHPMGSVDDYLHIVDDAEIDAVIFDSANFADRIRELKERSPRDLKLFALGDCDFAPSLSNLAIGYDPVPLVAPNLSGDETYKLIYSGGTTGKSKAVQNSYRSNYTTTIIQMAEWEWPSPPRLLLCAPLSHSGSPMSVPVLMRGGVVHILEAFDPTKVLEAIQELRPNCILLVPTMIYKLLDHPDFDKYDLSSLEVIYYGASTMSVPRLQEGIRRIGPIFFQFYGQAEAPMTITILRRSEHLVDDPTRLASCGRPVPWVDVTLLNDQGEPVPDEEPGEICVRGPLVMSEYLSRPDLTEYTFRHGWLHTGDVAVRDRDGFLRIVDRSKDMIITGGFNVYSREVEDALGTHPSVSAAAVFGIPDEKWGELVTAAVSLRVGCAVTAEELMHHVRKLKGPVQTPKRIEFVDQIPVTPVGKPNKNALRDRFGSREFARDSS